MKLKSLILIALVAAALLSLGGIGYLAFVHKSTSQLMTQASEAIKAGEKKKAKDILAKVVIRDRHNEGAFRLLAELSEEENDYYSSMYFWGEVMVLNPLDKKVLLKFFESAFFGGAGIYAYEKYIINKPTKDLTDPLLYRLCLIALGREDAELSFDIKEELSGRQSPYLALYQVNEALKEGTFNAFSRFAELYGQTESEGVRDCINVVLASDTLSRGELEKAIEHLELITGADPYAKVDATLLRAQCFLAQENVKEARAAFEEVYQMQRANIPLLLTCVELAFTDNDREAILKMTEELNVASKAGLALDYYLRALVASLAEENEKALQYINLAGSFQNRMVGRILKFKLASDLKDIKNAAESAQMLASAELPTKLKEVLQQHLLELISAAEKAEETEAANSLAAALLVIAPEHPIAVGYAMVQSLNSQDYAAAVRYADVLLKGNPVSDPAFEAKCIAYFGLRMYNEGYALTEAKLGQDPTSHVAAIFQARFASNSGRTEKAVQRYTEAAPYVAVEICEEAGNYIISSGQNPEEFIKSLESSEDPTKQMLAKGLLARLAMIENDTAKAESFLREAIALYPQAPGVRSALATLLYSLDRKEDARTVLEEAIQDNPNTDDLKVRLAALLLESDSREDQQKILTLLKDICVPQQKDGFPYAVLSAAQAALGQSEQAMQSALRADELGNGGSEAPYQLGLRYLEKRRYIEAIEPFRRAMQAGPNDARIPDVLVKAYNGAAAEADTDLLKKSYSEEVLKIQPTDETALEVLKKANEALEAAAAAVNE
ncbi:MAG: tetratricopeptide repeat protein [Limisphaerales bacterium]|jgi:tetratricopeptide (TPR) repeat protein|nr:tetratricopeptide repeat protein [Verrucomicrobiota bacterium]